MSNNRQKPKWVKIANFIGTKYVSNEELDKAMAALAGEDPFYQDPFIFEMKHWWYAAKHANWCRIYDDGCYSCSCDELLPGESKMADFEHVMHPAVFKLHKRD